MRYLWPVILFCLFLGCSEKINESPQNFSLVQGAGIPADQAVTIKICRDYKFSDGLLKVPIYCNDNWLLDLPVKMHVILTVKPGSYKFHTGEGTRPVTVTGVANQTYSFEPHLCFSWLKSKFELRRVTNNKKKKDACTHKQIRLTYLEVDSVKDTVSHTAGSLESAPVESMDSKTAFSSKVLNFFDEHPLIRYFGLLFIINFILLFAVIQIYARIKGPFEDVIELICFCILFGLAVFASGSIIPFYTCHWIPQPLFLYYLFICLTPGVCVAVYGLFFDDFISLSATAKLTFIVFLLSFYLGFLPLKLVLYFFPDFGSWVFILPWWKTTGIILSGLIIIGLNILMLVKLENLQDYSGGSEIARTGYWATLDGNFYMNATKRQTGEWTPPIGSFVKFLFLNSILIGCSVYFSSSLEVIWKVLIYSGLLVLANILLFITGMFRS